MTSRSRAGMFLVRRFSAILFATATMAVHAGNFADLAVAKTVNNATPFVGDTVTYTVTLANNGPNTATNVTVNDLLPADLTFVSATPSQGTYDNLIGVWNVGTLAMAAAPTLTIQALIANQNAVTNTATIVGNEPDPNPNNNSASATTTPQAPQADLAVTKTVSDSTPNVSDTIMFTVTVSNLGPSAASNVQVNDLLPVGLAFVSATPSQGTYDNLIGVWNIGSVSTSTAQTLLVQATVATALPQTNTATVAGDQFDPDGNNNAASATETPKMTPVTLQSFEVD